MLPSININFDFISKEHNNLSLRVGELWEIQELPENKLIFYVLTNLAIQAKYNGKSDFEYMSEFISLLKEEIVSFYKKRSAVKLMSIDYHSKIK